MKYDLNKTGKLTLEEFKELFAELKKENPYIEQNVSEKVVFDSLDLNSSGKIEWDN